MYKFNIRHNIELNSNISTYILTYFGKINDHKNLRKRYGVDYI